jgi:ferrochelatase
MTYGSPSGADDMPRYLAAVRGGKPAPAQLVAEFRSRYEQIGGSPLVSVTQRQRAALESRLGSGWGVAIGMRFSPPTIEEGLGELVARGATSIVGIVLSPQYSGLLMDGYRAALNDAARRLVDRVVLRIAGPWHEEPGLVEAFAERIREGLDDLPPAERDAVPVVLSAHSIPRRVAERDAAYVEQLRATAETVANRAGLAPERWRFAWQSAAHEPGEWMRPDLVELFPELAAAGHRSVLVAPIQFLADHLEVLYDIDIAAARQARAAGLRFVRARSLGTHPRLIDALAGVTQRVAAAHDREAA